MDDAKTDLTNLAGIYGAVDRQLESVTGREGAGGHPVTLLLPVYREPGAFWFERFVKEADSIEAWDVDPLGDPVDLARHALERLSESKAHCRNRARRLFAVGIAARTFPQLEPDLLAAAAFGPRTIEAFGGADAQPDVLADYLRRTP